MTENPSCTHPATSRKFGGAILCDDCTTVVGDWRTDPPLRLGATARPDDTPHADGPTR